MVGALGRPGVKRMGRHGGGGGGVVVGRQGNAQEKEEGVGCRGWGW